MGKHLKEGHFPCGLLSCVPSISSEAWTFSPIEEEVKSVPFLPFVLAAFSKFHAGPLTLKVPLP